MDKNLSYCCISPHLFRLRLFGYYQIHPVHKRHKMHKMYMHFTLFIMIFYTVQQAIKLYEVREDMDKVMATMFLFLTHTDAIYKQCVMWLNSDQLEELFDIMLGPLFNQKEDEHCKILLNNIKNSKYLLITYNSAAILTCFLWILAPLLIHLQGKTVESSIWLPFDANLNPHFYIVSMYSWIMTSWLAAGNTTMDCFMAFLLLHTKIQLSIVCDNLENLVERSRTEATTSMKSFPEIFHDRLRVIFQHYHLIMSFEKKIEGMFSNVIAYQFLVSGWILSTSVYQVAEVELSQVQIFSMFMYLACVLLQLSVFCFCGNESTNQSELLTDSTYLMNWLDVPLTYRRHLIIFMERIKRPIQPLAGKIIPLSNYTFVSIVKSSFSLYALLTNTK